MWKKIFIICLSMISILSITMLFVVAEFEITTTQDFISLLKGQKRYSVVDYTYENTDGLTYSANDNGIITVEKDNNVIGKYGEAITGKINNVSQIKTIEDFTWTWSKSNYTYIQREYVNESDAENNITTNVSYRVDVFTAYNNQPNFNWTRIWEFNPLRPVKFTSEITNDLGENITNVKFWYINTIDKDKPIVFNNTKYFLNDNTKHFQGNFNNVLQKIDFGQYEFRYWDLIDNGFDITNVYIGNGSIIGHPNVYIVGIGVTKGDSVLQDGATIVLDPETTGLKSAGQAGLPVNEWTNSNPGLLISDDDYGTAAGLSEPRVDTSLYGFSIPEGSTIVGIEVRIEGYSKRVPFSCP